MTSVLCKTLNHNRSHWSPASTTSLSAAYRMEAQHVTVWCRTRFDQSLSVDKRCDFRRERCAHSPLTINLLVEIDLSHHVITLHTHSRTHFSLSYLLEKDFGPFRPPLPGGRDSNNNCVTSITHKLQTWPTITDPPTHALSCLPPWPMVDRCTFYCCCYNLRYAS